jgi:hypothetical protein
MGGYGSGRQYGRPLAEEARRIDLAWMIRKGLAVPGAYRSGTLSWTCGNDPAGRIGFTCDMREPDSGELVLQYTITDRWGDDARDYKHRIRLSCTQPHFGGRRWWMHCPVNGQRVGKLYMPSDANVFASRTAWRLGYRSQRITERDAVFERLFRLQRRLGCTEGWEMPIRRPKGMHHRTFAKLEDQYWRLDHQCGVEMAGALEILRGSFGGQI